MTSATSLAGNINGVLIGLTQVSNRLAEYNKKAGGMPKYMKDLEARLTPLRQVTEHIQHDIRKNKLLNEDEKPLLELYTAYRRKLGELNIILDKVSNNPSMLKSWTLKRDIGDVQKFFDQWMSALRLRGAVNRSRLK